MKLQIVVFSSVILLASCGSTSGTDRLNIDDIRIRLDENACRIVREDLVFQLGEFEFTNDTTYSVLPVELLTDSLLACPVSGEFYTMTADGNDRFILCPSGHGSTEF